MGYRLSYKENNIQGKKYYAWIIYKSYRELGLPLLPLPEMRMLVTQFLLKNPGAPYLLSKILQMYNGVNAFLLRKRINFLF
jgi:hypothetical protein